MDNSKDLDFKSFEQYSGVLNSKAAMKTKLALLRQESKNIFDTDEDGNIKYITRGKFKKVPLMNKLWILAHLRKVVAFLAAVLQFIESLNLEDTETSAKAKAVAPKPVAPKAVATPPAAKAVIAPVKPNNPIANVGTPSATEKKADDKKI